MISRPPSSCSLVPVQLAARRGTVQRSAVFWWCGDSRRAAGQLRRCEAGPAGGRGLAQAEARSAARTAGWGLEVPGGQGGARHRHRSRQVSLDWFQQVTSGHGSHRLAGESHAPSWLHSWVVEGDTVECCGEGGSGHRVTQCGGGKESVDSVTQWWEEGRQWTQCYAVV